MAHGTTSTRGNVTFFNRSVRVQGSIDGLDEEEQAVHSCRYTGAVTNHGASGYSRVFCGSSGVFTIDLPADYVGGASSVVITFYFSEPLKSFAVSRATISR